MRVGLSTRAVCLCIVLAVWSLVPAGGYALLTVKDGDSLGAIADRYRVAVEVLREANDLSDDVIYPGWDEEEAALHFEAAGEFEEAAELHSTLGNYAHSGELFERAHDIHAR